MGSARGQERALTLFGELLRQRRQTAEEFSEAAEAFARDHGLKGTISPRHVRRLASGKRDDGRDLGPVTAATGRLLGEMLGVPIERLLEPVQHMPSTATEGELALRGRIAAGRALDLDTVALMRTKLDITRIIDRRLGASALHSELCGQIDHMERALRDVLVRPVREALAELLVDAAALAGWQSLDRGLVDDSWNQYDTAKAAARAARSVELEAYACAGQAVVLLDIGETDAAMELTQHALELARGRVPHLLYSWLSAGYGEACAANGNRAQCLMAFDDALRALPARVDGAETPYLVFDSTHLARWRGSALARLGDPDAIEVLSDVLGRLDPTFARAETTLRVDLVQALTENGVKDEAASHAERARLLAAQVGSRRQQKRLAALVG